MPTSGTPFAWRFTRIFNSIQTHIAPTCSVGKRDTIFLAGWSLFAAKWGTSFRETHSSNKENGGKGGCTQLDNSKLKGHPPGSLD